MIIVKAIKCPKCQCTIFSRAHHDFRTCPCGTVSIDGGFDYTRLLFPSGTDSPEIFGLEIEQTVEELYNDWNLSHNKFGIIEKEDVQDR